MVKIMENTSAYKRNLGLAVSKALRQSNIYFFTLLVYLFCFKVDVYSFGVLLCEICIRKLPNPDRRDRQVAMVTDRSLRGLIRRCIHQDPQARPSMEDIIEELEQLV